MNFFEKVWQGVSGPRRWRITYLTTAALILLLIYGDEWIFWVAIALLVYAVLAYRVKRYAERYGLSVWDMLCYCTGSVAFQLPREVVEQYAAASFRKAEHSSAVFDAAAVLHELVTYIKPDDVVDGCKVWRRDEYELYVRDLAPRYECAVVNILGGTSGTLTTVKVLTCVEVTKPPRVRGWWMHDEDSQLLPSSETFEHAEDLSYEEAEPYMLELSACIETITTRR